MQLLRGVNAAMGDARRVAGGPELSFSLQKGVSLSLQKEGVSAVATTYSRSPIAQRYAPSRSGKSGLPCAEATLVSLTGEHGGCPLADSRSRSLSSPSWVPCNRPSCPDRCRAAGSFATRAYYQVRGVCIGN